MDTWVSLAALAGAMSVLLGYLRSMRAEFRGDIAVSRQATNDLRTELKDDIAELRTELKNDIAELRTELKNDIAACHQATDNLRTELKTDIADLRMEIKSDVAELRMAVATLDARVYDLNTSVTGLLAREAAKGR